MKANAWGVLSFGLILSCGACVTGPERIVQEQVRAYNARDLDWFVGLYTEDATIRKLLTNEIVGQGRAYFLDRYGQRFSASPDLHATIHDRIVLGKYVIDFEEVVRRKSDPTVSALAIYSVDEGKIDNVWFVFDEDVKLDAKESTRAAMARHEDAILRHDPAAYENTLAPEAQTLSFPDGRVLAGSREEIMAGIRPFLEGMLRFKRYVIEQIIFGNLVITYERQKVGDASRWTDRVVIYEFLDGRIRRCWIISEQSYQKQ